MRNAEKLLQRLDWTVIRRLDGLLQGDYRTLFHGFGLDLAEIREYELTDDVRYIDWNVTARMNAPYVRQYMEDREVTAWFLLDFSPSVDFGAAERTKRDVLIEFVAVLSRLLTRHGNRVGAIFYSGEIDGVVPAGNSRHQVLSMTKAMLDQPKRATSPPTDLSKLLTEGLRLIKRRSLIFILSDFLSAPGWERSLAILARRHELLAVRLHDPGEMELPDVGLVRIQDAETGEQLLVDTHDRAFRRRFVESALRRETQLKAALSRSGVDAVELSTRDDLAREIVRQARLRKQRKALPAAFAKPAAGGQP
ncbi:MAG: DUF58 domain-containing protein [Chloroflexi bacterium]|nr:DUF58 domain-containing protein [Chloroflexota bacterium]